MYHYCNTVFRGCIYVVIRHIGQKTGLKDNLPENYNDYPQNYPYEDESSNCHGQYATDSISLLPLRGRHHPFTRPRAATLSVAITAYTITFGAILRIIKKIIV